MDIVDTLFNIPTFYIAAEIVFSFLILFALLASIRLGLEGFVRFSENGILEFVTHEGWCWILFLIMPMWIGMFGRSESSPLPWIEFAKGSSQNGFFDAIIGAAIVLLADFWLFWIPANIWINKHKDSDKIKRRMARIINFLLGLMLASVANPFYSFISSLS